MLGPRILNYDRTGRETQLSRYQFQKRLKAVALEIRVMYHELMRVHSNVVNLLAVTWEEVHVSEGHPVFVPWLIR